MVTYFVTGATGFIGSLVVDELLKAGHKVIGLARSEASIKKLQDKGADYIKGDLEDLESLKKGAKSADGVIHLGFVHDFTRYVECCEIDRRATEAIAEALEGTGKTFVYTNGPMGLATPVGSPILDETHTDFSYVLSIPPGVRVATELYVLSLKDKGIKGVSVRLSPTVHGEGDKAFIPFYSHISQKNGYAAYIDEGLQQWSTVHRSDAAKLFKLVAENGVAGTAYHAFAENVYIKDVAQAIADKYKIPTKSITTQEAPEALEWLGDFFSANIPGKSDITQKALGWKPTAPTLLEDIKNFY